MFYDVISTTLRWRNQKDITLVVVLLSMSLIVRARHGMEQFGSRRRCMGKCALHMFSKFLLCLLWESWIEMCVRSVDISSIHWGNCGAYIDGLAQDCSNSSALAMELLQSCTKPSICVCAVVKGSRNCMLPVRCQAITRTSAGLLSIGPLWMKNQHN